MEKATFAAGCFWGIENTFSQLKGVISTAVGYTGGNLDNPNYQDVCTGNTGHAEVVELEYDPSKITYEELLEVFWNLHDPTSLNRQGPDRGTQYRSAIYFHTDGQQQAAQESKQAKAPKYDKPIVTEITKASTFYRAEEYHQKYYKKQGMLSCSNKEQL